MKPGPPNSRANEASVASLKRVTAIDATTTDLTVTIRSWTNRIDLWIASGPIYAIICMTSAISCRSRWRESGINRENAKAAETA